MISLTNYKQARYLPPAAVERMWRALDAIAESCEFKHPADPEFMTKDQIREAALRALPNGRDSARDDLASLSAASQGDAPAGQRALPEEGR